MSLQFDRVRGRDGPTVEAAMQAWTADHPDAETESVTVHRDAKGHTVYSLLYREAG